MTTPLEDFISDVKNSRKDLCLDTTRLAVGTDKRGFSPLLDGVKWISNVTASVEELPKEWVTVPLCYSYELVTTGAEWSAPGNEKWISRVVNGSDRPMACHVFHSTAASALLDAGGTCDVEGFRRLYRGRENATYKELVAILGAGYTRVTDFDREGHAILWCD